MSPVLAGEFFTTAPPAAAAAKSLQSCLTLCDPTDGSLPGSSVPGILQAALGSPQINHISIYDIWAKSEITYLVKCFILLKKFTFKPCQIETKYSPFILHFN